MFPVIRNRENKSDGRKYRYLEIVESYRENGKTKQRVIGRLGNIDKYSQSDILRLINKLREFLTDSDSIYDVETVGIKEYGISYVVDFFWKKFDLASTINQLLKDKKIDFDVPLYIKIMLINRLNNPLSNLDFNEQLNDLALPELEKYPLNKENFYSAIDYLCEIKAPLESYLYEKAYSLLTQAYPFVFCGLTHISFHNAVIPDSGNDYLKDFRPITLILGLYFGTEGTPVAHNTLYFRENLEEALLDKMRDFRFAKRIDILVSNSKIIPNIDIRELEKNRLKYIIGYDKNDSILSNAFLEEHKDLTQYSELPDENLLYKEINVQLSKGDKFSKPTKFILCHNLDKAHLEKSFREQYLCETGKDTATLFDHNQEIIEQEVLGDGKFLIKTNSELNVQKIVQIYQSFTKIETIFRELRGFTNMNPVFTYSQQYKVHIFICILANLFERWLKVSLQASVGRIEHHSQFIKDSIEKEKVLENAKIIRQSSKDILSLLKKVKLVEHKFLGIKIYKIIQPDLQLRLLLEALRIPVP